MSGAGINSFRQIVILLICIYLAMQKYGVLGQQIKNFECYEQIFKTCLSNIGSPTSIRAWQKKITEPFICLSELFVKIQDTVAERTVAGSHNRGIILTQFIWPKD